MANQVLLFLRNLRREAGINTEERTYRFIVAVAGGIILLAIGLLVLIARIAS